MKKIFLSAAILSGLVLGHSAPTFAAPTRDCEGEALACYGDCSVLFGNDPQKFLQCIDQCDQEKLVCLVVKILEISMKEFDIPKIKR